jgi:hypothetical protein
MSNQEANQAADENYEIVKVDNEGYEIIQMEGFSDEQNHWLSAILRELHVDDGGENEGVWVWVNDRKNKRLYYRPMTCCGQYLFLRYVDYSDGNEVKAVFNTPGTAEHSDPDGGLFDNLFDEMFA